MGISKQSKFVLASTFLLITCGVKTNSAEASTLDSLNSDIHTEVIEGKENPIPPAFGFDPEDPTNNGTNHSGLLKIDRVPNFSFGKVVRSGLYQEEYAVNTNPYVQVSDLRGSFGGWTLYAKISTFVSEPTSQDQKKYLLSGATLTLNAGEVLEFDSEHAKPPKSYSVALNNQQQKVMAATKDAGQGIWASKWKSELAVNKNITLDILPDTAKEGRNYVATISWKLADVPTTSN